MRGSFFLVLRVELPLNTAYLPLTFISLLPHAYVFLFHHTNGKRDPVLRMWAALVLREPMPKDHLVTEALVKLDEAKESAAFLNVLQELLELAKDGSTRIDMEALVQVVKSARLRVGADVWSKQVAKRFGKVLQVLRK